MDLGNAENGHGRVADELLDRAAVSFENPAQFGVVTGHPLLDDLRIGVVAERGRADQVAKENGDGLADGHRRSVRRATSFGEPT